jgi:hypothetical protein
VTSLFPLRESLVGDILAGDGNIKSFFYCVFAYCVYGAHRSFSNGILVDIQ